FAISGAGKAGARLPHSKALRILRVEGVIYRMVAQAAVLFVFGQVSDADLRKIGSFALVNLFYGKIFLLDVVGAILHVFAVVGRGGNYRASFVDTHAKLARGRLVVGD